MEYYLGDFSVEIAGEVRLFPLPNLVLFPGCIQALHIFESRYREMIEDTMREDGLLAIATLQPGYEVDYYSRPPVAEHICVGRVIAHEQTEQETHNLVLAGVRRAQIKHEITPVRSYRRAVVEIIEDAPMDAVELARKTGLELAACVQSASESAGQLSEVFRQGKIDLAALTDVIAFYFPLELELKLELLKQPDPLVRAGILIESLAITPKPGGKRSSRAAEQDCPVDRPNSFPPRFGDN